MSVEGSKSEVPLPARHVRCTLKSGRHQTQAEVHSIARVSSHPYPTQLAKMPWPAWHKKHNKYRARIGFRGKVVELGFYNTAREAARAYDHVAARVFGEFAMTNKQLGLLKICLRP